MIVCVCAGVTEEDIRAGKPGMAGYGCGICRKRITEIMNQQRPSETTEHYTPFWIIDLARNLMGSIDLDPASSEKANENVVKAKRIHTITDDGLLQNWFGNVFCNPPGQPSKWFKKIVKELLCGNTKEFFFVVYSIDRLPTILKICRENGIYPFVLVPHNRVEYLNCETLAPQTQPLHGSAFVYMGKNAPVVQSIDNVSVLRFV